MPVDFARWSDVLWIDVRRRLTSGARCGHYCECGFEAAGKCRRLAEGGWWASGHAGSDADMREGGRSWAAATARPHKPRRKSTIDSIGLRRSARSWRRRRGERNEH